MWVRHAWIWIAVVTCGTFGCGSKTETPPAAATNTVVVNPASPQECVQFFLESVRKGDDKTAEAMLTDLARKKTQEFNLQVAPPGSNTASFEIGEVKLIGDKETEEGAYVASKWTDVGDDGKPRTDEIMWIVTHDPNGWRIVGMGVKVFEDLEPVYLNFEDPQDMLQKQQMVETEMARRAGVLPQTQPGTQPAGTASTVGSNDGTAPQSGALAPTSGINFPPAVQAQTPAVGGPAAQAQLPGSTPGVQFK